MRLKKTVALALVTAMAATMAAGCGSSSSDKGSAAPESTAAGSEAAGGAADSKETRERGCLRGKAETDRICVGQRRYTSVYFRDKGIHGKISGCGSGVSLTLLPMSTQTR